MGQAVKQWRIAVCEKFSCVKNDIEQISAGRRAAEVGASSPSKSL